MTSPARPGMNRGMRPIRVLTIFVRAGTDTYPDAEAHLDALFDRQLPALARDVIVVDNLLPPGVAQERPGRAVIGGDNSVWEFSAVDVAVAHAGAAIWRYDLRTSDLGVRAAHVAYLERFRDVLAAIAGAPVCLGHIDCYNAPVRIGPFRASTGCAAASSCQ
jgi:hypothetical protein